MTKILPKRAILRVLFAVALISVAAAFSPAFGQKCDDVPDSQVVSSIYAKLERDKSLAGQVSHINISVVRDPVSGRVQAWKATGWVKSQKDFDNVRLYMNRTFYDLGGIDCVGGILFNVNDLLLESELPDGLRSAGGCGPGTVACGDICIPQGEVCSITGKQ